MNGIKTAGLNCTPDNAMSKYFLSVTPSSSKTETRMVSSSPVCILLVCRFPAADVIVDPEWVASSHACGPTE